MRQQFIDELGKFLTYWRQVSSKIRNYQNRLVFAEFQKIKIGVFKNNCIIVMMWCWLCYWTPPNPLPYNACTTPSWTNLQSIETKRRGNATYVLRQLVRGNSTRCGFSGMASCRLLLRQQLAAPCAGFRDNTSALCDGHGRCDCGRCICDAVSPTTPQLRYTGTYCQCNDYNCDYHDGKICGGLCDQLLYYCTTTRRLDGGYNYDSTAIRPR